MRPTTNWNYERAVRARSTDRCSSCERPTWRRHGSHFGWGRDFICSRCLAEILHDEAKEAY